MVKFNGYESKDPAKFWLAKVLFSCFKKTDFFSCLNPAKPTTTKVDS
jgi:hypothetical protein